jgi:hypothetical protein
MIFRAVVEGGCNSFHLFFSVDNSDALASIGAIARHAAGEIVQTLGLDDGCICNIYSEFDLQAQARNAVEGGKCWLYFIDSHLVMAGVSAGRGPIFVDDNIAFLLDHERQRVIDALENARIMVSEGGAVFS